MLVFFLKKGISYLFIPYICVNTSKGFVKNEVKNNYPFLVLMIINKESRCLSGIIDSISHFGTRISENPNNVFGLKFDVKLR